MTNYIIYFNQQWVGEHTSEWFQSRGPLARKVVEDMKAAGVLVFAGGLDGEIKNAFSSDESGVISGPITKDGEFLGGLTIINVTHEDEAKAWGSKVAVACGWPQEIREIS